MGESGICTPPKSSPICFGFCQVHEVTSGLFFSLELEGNYSCCRCEIKSVGGPQSRYEYSGSSSCHSNLSRSILVGPAAEWSHLDVCILPAECLNAAAGEGRCSGGEGASGLLEECVKEEHQAEMTKREPAFFLLSLYGSNRSRELFQQCAAIRNFTVNRRL